MDPCASCDAKLATSVKLHHLKTKHGNRRSMIRLGHYLAFASLYCYATTSIIRFQKGLDSAPGNDSRQASPAFLFQIQQSFSLFRSGFQTAKKPRHPQSPPFKLGRLLLIRQYYANRNCKNGHACAYRSQLSAVVSSLCNVSYRKDCAD